MTPREALAFVRRHGVVLESARGGVPSLAEAVGGGPMRGSWWSHPKAQEIFRVTRAIRDSEEVLVCRLVGGKVTYVHRRLWPSLVRASSRFRRDRLARVREAHTPSGDHLTEEIAFPKWVPAAIRAAARRLALEAALAKLAPWLG